MGVIISCTKKTLNLEGASPNLSVLGKITLKMEINKNLKWSTSRKNL